ncbi:MAG TPA: flagellar basal body L-ring protein FlgH [Azospirillaceae bacterium]|nr:flagellar basal body L-ring protein FlgH [Azospirillaceae bacterium]
MTAAKTSRPAFRLLARTAMLGALVMGLSACNTVQRLSDVGNPPALNPIQDPHAQAGYTPVSLPMPSPQVAERNPNSLWRSGARSFFKDQRAKQVGDILTVMIEIEDKAELENQTSRGRDNSEEMGLPNLFGLETGAGRGLRAILPDAANPGSLMNMNSATNSRGTGAITRQESIELKVAALVTQVLPNGNLVIQGRQEVRVNFEVRDLVMSGVIRPEDITAQNTVSYEKIAEARISYGGRGQITDVQQPRYGQQIFDIISPF